jgi:hypothetical protein
MDSMHTENVIPQVPQRAAPSRPEEPRPQTIKEIKPTLPEEDRLSDLDMYDNVACTD